MSHSFPEIVSYINHQKMCPILVQQMCFFYQNHIAPILIPKHVSYVNPQKMFPILVPILFPILIPVFLLKPIKI